MRMTARVRYSVIFLSLSHAAHPVSQVWSSEESSTTDTPAGGACWARLLSQNYVVGNITATIMWNLVSSYYSSLPYFGASLYVQAHPPRLFPATPFLPLAEFRRK